MLAIKVNTRRFTQLLSALGEEARTRLHDRMAQGLQILLRAHFKKEAPRRHSSARRLGASPTGHLERVTIARRADASGGYVGIASPGIRRALEPLNIRPRNSAALTIPVAREAYGRRAGELAARGWDLYQIRSKAGKGLLFGRRPGEKDGKPFYVLRASATIPQDRTLLPSNQELSTAVSREVSTLLTNIRSRS